MIKLNSTSIKNADVGDWLVVKPYGSYVAFAGVVIQQTDCSYAFMYLPECHTFPWGGKCNSVEKLIKELNFKFEFVEKANVDLPITIHTFQDVSLEDNRKERQKVIRKIVEGLEKDEGLVKKGEKNER
ncbi:hypothetical protein [Lactobacillus gasseri]|uniref:Uncharacterized protein n=1 Tax=Lactobacillus gasseri TaxID=1596 RepID=A0AB33CHG6_LACGS|nr:hypothetical protein [Lactobacillus gasseri]ART99194.1 hypothetical protein CCE30_10015 [Lactobacillus gasseri]RBQ00731.1 hypothetical protein C3745_07370 [Lactobacillus gasseri]